MEGIENSQITGLGLPRMALTSQPAPAPPVCQRVGELRRRPLPNIVADQAPSPLALAESIVVQREKIEWVSCPPNTPYLGGKLRTPVEILGALAMSNPDILIVHDKAGIAWGLQRTLGLSFFGSIGERLAMNRKEHFGTRLLENRCQGRCHPVGQLCLAHPLTHCPRIRTAMTGVNNHKNPLKRPVASGQGDTGLWHGAATALCYQQEGQ